MAIIKIAHFNRIFISKRCQKEIVAATAGYSRSQDFQKWLYENLRELDDPQNDYIHDFPKKFEQLTPVLYGITYRHGEKNIRIIFSLSHDGMIRVLLCCFDEKNTKADYKRYIPLAERRRVQESLLS